MRWLEIPHREKVGFFLHESLCTNMQCFAAGLAKGNKSFYDLFVMSLIFHLLYVLQPMATS